MELCVYNIITVKHIVMAQVENTRSAAVGKHNSRTSRKSLFIDLTPMVDLAFLLISFFMLTTVLQENMSMELKMPENTGEPIPIAHSRTITLIADANNQLYYYNGEDMQNLSKSNYSNAGLRQLLYERIQQQRAADPGKGLICIIKLTGGADYNDMINLLDEMEITNVPTYAIQDITEAEKEQLNIFTKNN